MCDSTSLSHCLPGGLAVEPLQQTLQQNRALHRSTTHPPRHAADVELYSSTALYRPKICQLSAKYRVFSGYTWKPPRYTWKIPGILPVSSVSPQILPQTSSQTQGNSRVARMEHQTPSGFPGNFRKRKVLETLSFPFWFPETWVQRTGQP